MKYFLVALVAFILYTGCQQRTTKSAGEQTVEAKEDTTEFTTIEWIDSTYHDMGKIHKGEELEIPFRFKNTGNKPLIIEDVRPGCGCTIADKPAEPIAPGEEGVIRAKFSSGEMSGLQNKNLTVQANTKNSKTHFLTFSVTVEK